jgi:hypothetical protein
MGNKNSTVLDRLSDKHELLSLILDFPECYQVLQVTQDGRDLQVIVPLFYDGTRVGEVLASALVGEIVFLTLPARQGSRLRPGCPGPASGSFSLLVAIPKVVFWGVQAPFIG